jgi:Sulfotransferase domain
MPSSLRERAVRSATTAYEVARGQLYLNIGHDYRDTVFLAGSGRGGTTWVAELINFDNSYRMIFEGLRDRRFRPLHRRYLRPENDDPALLALARSLVSGRVRDLRADRFNRQPFPRKRLVKEIVANLSLSWLHRHFPEIPIVLIVRHPGAVVQSRLRLGWTYGLRIFLRQEPLMSEVLAPFREGMERASSQVEIQTYHWCVETLVALKQFKRGEMCFAFYEDVCADPRSELTRLFAFLQKPIDERAFAAVERPSSQTYRALPSREALMHGWRKHFTDGELGRMNEIVAQFGLDRLYGGDGAPDMAAAQQLFSG